MQLSCAMDVGTNEEKAAAYVSLAQTSVDLKDYRGAVEYYLKEIECRTDKTQVNTANELRRL